MPLSVHGCQCRLGRGHAISVQETKSPRTATPLPIGAEDLHQPQWREDPGVPVLMERRASGREAGLGHSGSSVVGGLAGRLGMESLELGKRRGLLQGLLVGPALAPALDVQAGTVGQARALAPHPP